MARTQKPSATKSRKNTVQQKRKEVKKKRPTKQEKEIKHDNTQKKKTTKGKQSNNYKHEKTHKTGILISNISLNAGIKTLQYYIQERRIFTRNVGIYKTCRSRHPYTLARDNHYVVPVSPSCKTVLPSQSDGTGTFPPVGCVGRLGVVLTTPISAYVNIPGMDIPRPASPTPSGTCPLRAYSRTPP